MTKEQKLKLIEDGVLRAITPQQKLQIEYIKEVGAELLKRADEAGRGEEGGVILGLRNILNVIKTYKNTIPVRATAPHQTGIKNIETAFDDIPAVEIRLGTKVETFAQWKVRKDIGTLKGAASTTRQLFEKNKTKMSPSEAKLFEGFIIVVEERLKYTENSKEDASLKAKEVSLLRSHIAYLKTKLSGWEKTKAASGKTKKDYIETIGKQVWDAVSEQTNADRQFGAPYQKGWEKLQTHFGKTEAERSELEEAELDIVIFSIHKVKAGNSPLVDTPTFTEWKAEDDNELGLLRFEFSNFHKNQAQKTHDQGEALDRVESKVDKSIEDKKAQDALVNGALRSINNGMDAADNERVVLNENQERTERKVDETRDAVSRLEVEIKALFSKVKFMQTRADRIGHWLLGEATKDKKRSAEFISKINDLQKAIADIKTKSAQSEKLLFGMLLTAKKEATKIIADMKKQATKIVADMKAEVFRLEAKMIAFEEWAKDKVESVENFKSEFEAKIEDLTAEAQAFGLTLFNFLNDIKETLTEQGEELAEIKKNQTKTLVKQDQLESSITGLQIGLGIGLPIIILLLFANFFKKQVVKLVNDTTAKIKSKINDKKKPSKKTK